MLYVAAARLARIAQELALFAPALSRSSLAWHGGVRHGPGTGLSRAARASGPASRRRTDELAGKDSKQDCSSRLEKLRGSWKSTTLGRAGGATRRRSQSSRRRWLRCQSMWRCQSSRLWRRLPRYLQFSKFMLFRLFFRMFFLEHVLPRACSSGLFLPDRACSSSSVQHFMNMLYVVYLPIYQVSIHQQRYTSTAAILLINSIFISLHQPPFPQPPACHPSRSTSMGHHPHPHPRHGLCPCLATSHSLSRGTTRTPPAPRWTLAPTPMAIPTKRRSPHRRRPSYLTRASSLHRMRMDLEPAAAVPCYSCRLAQTMKDPGKARPL